MSKVPTAQHETRITIPRVPVKAGCDARCGGVHACNWGRGTEAGKFLVLWPASLPKSMSFSVQWETMFQNIRRILIQENIQH